MLIENTRVLTGRERGSGLLDVMLIIGRIVARSELSVYALIQITMNGIPLLVNLPLLVYRLYAQYTRTHTYRFVKPSRPSNYLPEPGGFQRVYQ